MRYRISIQAVAIAVSIAVIFPAHSGEVEVLEMSTPAGEQTSLSRLTSDSKGTMYLSWVASSDNVSTLYFSTLVEDEWGDAEMITQGKDWYVNWADFPCLSVNDNTKSALWLQKSGEGTYDYDINATFFDQAAQSWGDAIVIHRDGIRAEHGFVSMQPMAGDRTLVSWLDGRNTPAGGAMTLRAAIFGQDGRTINDWELDDRVCECCQTSTAMSAAGPVVVYRDRSAEEVRDIFITRLVAGKWTDPKPVFSDGWAINGCPVNGPAVSAKDQVTAVAWFTAKNNQPTVKLAISRNDGESFEAPIIVADGSTRGRVGITILESGNIAVSWLETGQTPQVKLALYDQQGQLLDQVRVAKASSSRRSGFPVIASIGDDVYVTWTDLVDTQVKVARVRF